MDRTDDLPEDTTERWDSRATDKSEQFATTVPSEEAMSFAEEVAIQRGLANFQAERRVGRMASGYRLSRQLGHGRGHGQVG